jgi:hypothetical protein
MSKFEKVAFSEMKKVDKQINDQKEAEARAKRKLMETHGIAIDPYIFADKLDFEY